VWAYGRRERLLTSQLVCLGKTYITRPTGRSQGDDDLVVPGIAGEQRSLASGVGLVFALVAPLVYALVVDPYLLSSGVGLNGRAVIGYVVMWSVSGAVLALTVFGERRPLSTVGFRPLPLGLIGVAVGAGVFLSLLVPVLSLFVEAIAGVGPSDVMDTGRGTAVWILAVGVVTAGVTEEILFRGYAIERLIERTGRPWLSCLISLAVFVAIHLPNWSVAHVMGVVLPLGLALTVLYLWKRNLPLVIVVHLLIDAPLIFLALAA